MCKCMSTTVHINGTVQFIFLLVMRLNITIVRISYSLIVILMPNFFHHWDHCISSTGSSNKIFIRILCAFNRCYVDMTFYDRTSMDKNK